MLKNRSVQTHAKLGLFGIALIWGLGFVVVKEALSTVGPMTFVTWRFLFASLLLFILFRKKFKIRLSFDEIRAGSIAGLCLITGFSLQTVGMLYTTAGKAGFITGLNIIMVPFLAALFLGHHIKTKEIVGTIIATLGLGLLCLNENLRFGAGDLWVVGCAVGFALQIVAIAAFAKKYDPFRFTVIQLGFGFLASFIVACFLENPFAPIPFQGWALILFMGVFCTAAVFVLQMWAQNHTTPTAAALLLGLESPLAAVFGWLLLNETMGLKEILGCGLIFAGMLFVTLRRGHAKPQL